MSINKTDILLQVSISKNNIWTITSKTLVNEFLSDFEIDDDEFIEALKLTQNSYSNQLVLFSVSLDIKAYRGFEGDYDINYTINVNFEEVLMNDYETYCTELFYNQLSYIQDKNKLEEIIEVFDIKFEPKEFMSVDDVVSAKEKNSLIELSFFRGLKEEIENKKMLELNL